MDVCTYVRMYVFICAIWAGKYMYVLVACHMQLSILYVAINVLC